MDRRTLLRRGLPVALVGLAGCTGDGGGSGSDGSDGGGGYGGGGGTDSPTPTPTSTSTATDSPTPAPNDSSTPTATDSPTATRTDTSTPTATAASTPEPDQRVVVGSGGEFRFEPENFGIEQGDTVLWVFETGGHNVSPGAQPEDADWSGDDETTYPAGHTYAYTFEVTGTYEYHCDPHRSLGMTGSFTVE